MNKAILIALACTVLSPMILHAQTDSDATPSAPVKEKATMLAIGSADILDTYLSPELYSGTALSIMTTAARHRAGSPLTREQLWTIRFTDAENRAANSNHLGGFLNYQYSWRYRIPCQQVDLQVGPMAEALLGGLYNTRNGNNPAQLYANAALGAVLTAGKDFTLFKKHIHARYHASMPLLGAAFTPQYGQSYYEIFTRGSYDHNIVVTSPTNAASLRHMLTLDIPVWRHTLRIGYLGEYRQRDANNIKTHDYAHMLIIGYVINK